MTETSDSETPSVRLESERMERRALAKCCGRALSNMRRKTPPLGSLFGTVRPTASERLQGKQGDNGLLNVNSTSSFYSKERRMKILTIVMTYKRFVYFFINGI